MLNTLKRFTPILLLLSVFCLTGIGCMVDDADARSRGGGRSFSRSRTATPPPVKRTAPQKSSTVNKSRSGGFMSGLAGGLMGGAIGSLLFGGMAHGGMGGGIMGSGIGLFQILLMAGIGYFIYKRFFKKPAASGAAFRSTSESTGPYDSGPAMGGSVNAPPPPSSFGGGGTLEDGLAEIRRSEPGFDPQHFSEIASDVFFQVQAGWMRRDVQSYRHLLGVNLAAEYEGHFADLRAKGHINKLENISIRKVEIVDAGVDGNEEFVTVLFTANLLDYTVDEKSDAVVEGSKTNPVKFAEEWTWARSVGSENWKLEGIKVV